MKPITSVVKRMWLVPAVVAVAVIGGLGIYRLHGIFGVHEQTTIGDAFDRDVPDFDPKRVTYEVFGPAATAKIAYLDPDAKVQRLESTPLPWSQTITTPLPAVSVNLMAQSSGDMLGCRIIVNGAVKDQKSANGLQAMAMCSVTSA
jgi:hypothetical protein